MTSGPPCITWLFLCRSVDFKKYIFSISSKIPLFLINLNGSLSIFLVIRIKIVAIHLPVIADFNTPVYFTDTSGIAEETQVLSPLPDSSFTCEEPQPSTSTSSLFNARTTSAQEPDSSLKVQSSVDGESNAVKNKYAVTSALGKALLYFY